MPTYIALLRAINVGGNNPLPMTTLTSLAQTAGFKNPRTYIASGNLLFSSPLPAPQVHKKLAAALKAHTGTTIDLHIRTADEMAQVLADNPFPAAAPNRTVAIFLSEPPPANLLSTLSGQKDEQVLPGRREIYVHYGNGMATTKLKIPAAKSGTARNLNTIAKLATLAKQNP